MSEFKYIINEFIQTEKKYVEKLKYLIKNFVIPFDKDANLPLELKGKKKILFSSIEEILDFHVKDFLPALEKNSKNLTKTLDCFTEFVENDFFYPYFILIENNKRSEILFKANENYFMVKIEIQSRRFLSV